MNSDLPKTALDSDLELEDFNAENDEMSLQEGISQLSAFFEQELKALDNIQHIFDKYLATEEFNPEQGKLLFESLCIYCGQDNANFLSGLITNSLEDSNLFLEIKALNSDIEKVIRLLSSLYGNALNKAYLMQDENPDSWRVVLPRINYEVLSKQWLIHLIIEKFNGEATVYEESPLSIVQLVTSLLKILNQIPSKDAPKTISLEDLIEFQEAFHEFIQHFKIDEI